VLCKACGEVNVGIGATHLLEGLRFWFCGIGGWCKGSKSVLGSILLPAPLEMSKMVSLGLLWRFMGLLLIAIEGTYRRSWLVCLVGRICCGALGEISTSSAFLVKDWMKHVLVSL